MRPSGRQNFLQTDTFINHGNSGSTLINTLGKLMGINKLSFDKSNNGVGFAIPTALAIKVMNKLIRDDRMIRNYIGISGCEVAPMHNSVGLDHIQDFIVNDVIPDGFGGVSRYSGGRYNPGHQPLTSHFCDQNDGSDSGNSSRIAYFSKNLAQWQKIDCRGCPFRNIPL